MTTETVAATTALTTPVTTRDAAIRLWGEAGAHAHDAYDRQRHLLPELPDELPITIGLSAYGHCRGLTRTQWEHGPRIFIASTLFADGAGVVEDVMLHEMLHAWLAITGRQTAHASKDWYAAVRRLSPAVLGTELDVRRGSDRRSVRVPNPAREVDPDAPPTLVRKVAVADAIPHHRVARWPGAFRPDDYDPGRVIACPTY